MTRDEKIAAAKARYDALIWQIEVRATQAAMHARSLTLEDYIVFQRKRSERERAERKAAWDQLQKEIAEAKAG